MLFSFHKTYTWTFNAFSFHKKWTNGPCGIQRSPCGWRSNSKVTAQSRNIGIPIFTRVWTKIYYEQVQVLNIPPLKTKPIVLQSIAIGVCPKQDKKFLKSGICFQTGQGNYLTFLKLCSGIRCLLSMYGTIISPDHSRLTLVCPLLGRSESPTSFEI